MRMDLGTRNTLLYDFMHCMTAVSLEMSDEPKVSLQSSVNQRVIKLLFKRCLIGLQKGVSKGLKGHLLQAKWASLRKQKSMF